MKGNEYLLFQYYRTKLYIRLRHVGEYGILNRKNSEVYHIAWSNECIEFWRHLDYYIFDNRNMNYIR